jgi:hypothetical protein
LSVKEKKNLLEKTESIKVSFKRRQTVLPPYPPEATTEEHKETAMTEASVQARPSTHSHTNKELKILC